ncbi:MAG: phosphocholine cytidylyltransferase family protein [Sphingomonadales bacterium]|jgi:1L-myo-inositol 1-phosphate cytidylyltransferase
MKAVIVAAGMGSRLQGKGWSKPLLELCGKPIISRVMDNAVAGGVTGFVVVTGYGAEQLAPHVELEAKKLGVSLNLVHNEDFEKPNGLSVVAASQAINGSFLLCMCDHLMDPEIVRKMVNLDPSSDETILGVDYRLDNPFVDMRDVTRVLEKDGVINAIGKGIPEYNCFDTGIFRTSPKLFEAILESAESTGDCSISGGMAILCQKGLARVTDIGDYLWIDIDDPNTYAKAETYIQRAS